MLFFNIVNSLSNSQGTINNLWGEVNNLWNLIVNNAFPISIWLFIFSVLCLILLARIIWDIWGSD